MPTYEYECKKCGDRFDAFQSITAEPLKRCKKCRGALRRLIGTGAGILFKGSGFYQTDYRDSSYKEASKADKEKASPPTAESTKKEKPAGKASGGSSKTKAGQS